MKWLDTVPWIMARTERFPKNLRYSLAQKIDNICLEILELIVQTIYSQAKREPLSKVNLRLPGMLVMRLAPVYLRVFTW